MNNPASRLHSILTRSREKELQQKNMMEGFRSVLQLPDDMDDMLTMNKVGKVLTLPQIVTLQIQRFDDLDHDLFLGWRNDLLNAFRHIYFQHNFREFAGKLSDSLLINIRFCAHELQKRLPEKALSHEDLVSLREDASRLFDRVLKSDLEPSLSRYLLDLVYRLIEAIDDYTITGAVGVERALNEAIGTVATARPVAEEVRQSRFGEDFWNLLGRVGTLLQLAKTATELGNGLTKLLQMGGNQQG